MDYLIVGIIVLAAMACVVACVTCVRATHALRDRNEIFWERKFNEERDWWQNQTDKALNRVQFPAVPLSIPGSPSEGSVTYVDERREYELESERNESNAAT